MQRHLSCNVLSKAAKVAERADAEAVVAAAEVLADRVDQVVVAVTLRSTSRLR